MARPRLQERRQALGHTQESLAAEIGVETSTVRRWETQDRAPLPQHRRRLAEALNVSATELARLLITTADTTPTGSLRSPTGEGIDPMIRRDLLRIALTSGALMSTTALNGPSPTTPESLSDLNAVGQHLWRVYGKTEAKTTLMPAVAEHLQTLHDHLSSRSRAADIRRLCELHSQALQLSGEILFDAGLYDEAADNYALAASAAREADAFDLWSCAMTRYALISTTEHRWRESLEVLDAAARVAARGDSTQPSRQWVASVQAEASAHAGAEHDTQRYLDRALTVHHLTGPVGNGGWLRFDGTRLPEQEAACLIALGKFDRAEARLETALHAPTTPRRTAAIRCDQATIALYRNDFDAVESYIGAAANLAVRTGSSYIAAKLADFNSNLNASAGASRRASTITGLIASTIRQT
ncbi:helix-turn-helix transcriptional regulator [Glycomyces sp. NPDC047010]|uniref:helix-turn-helix domain-containing protein n=1 Tax=Glycomyces sp. NPDC047010 TaxID=3155023 RepID=UPI0033E025D6